jgi:hypothetical protein
MAVGIIPEQEGIRPRTEIRKHTVAGIDTGPVIDAVDDALGASPREPGLHALPGVVLGIGVGWNQGFHMVYIYRHGSGFLRCAAMRSLTIP